jgi:hypothetical protein
LTLKPIQHFQFLSNLGNKFAKFPIFILELSQLAKPVTKIGKWPQFCTVSASFTIQFGKLKSSNHENLPN